MRTFILLFLSGCSSILGIEDFDLIDAREPEGGATYCVGPPGWRICLDAQPVETLSFTSAMNIRTSDSEFCLADTPDSWVVSGQPDSCVIIAGTISITGTMEVTGPRPLVLLAADAVRVTGRIDVASHTNTSKIAAGAPAPGCVLQKPPVGPGGGAGGSFITAGGDGGSGTPAPASPGEAAPFDLKPPSVLRAGCNGGTGGAAQGQMGGVAASGGGALYVLAGASIEFDGGTVNASGGAGRGAGIDSGGGGGGSGGMIVLSAPMIIGTGIVMANGGGGATGGGAGVGGSTGMEPMSPFSPAKGGSGGQGGAGGDGYADAQPATAGKQSSISPAGGGGGGGGSGLVLTSVQLPLQVMVSPKYRMF